MSTTTLPGGIVARAKAILLTPAAAWPAIAAEPDSIAGLYTGYIVILAAITPLASFIHGVVFGYGALGFSYHPSFFGALTTAIVTYLFALAGTFVMAFIVAALAPTFQGQNNPLQALKLVAYAATASWLAGVFNLIPGLGMLALLGLYSLYLFYIGLPVLMQSPPEKSLPYTLVIFVAAIVVGVVVSFAASNLTGGVPFGRMAGGGGSISFPADNGGADSGGGTITVPGGGSVQLDKFAQLGRAFASLDKSNQAGGAAATPGANTSAVSTASLKALLPSELPGGLARTESSSAGGQIAGIGGSSAQGTYGANGRQITLTVADLGAMGALAGAAGVFGISGDKETATSYSHITQKDGRTIAEEFDSTAKHGTYSVIIASRFLISAEGSQVGMDDLHEAVSMIDAARLEGLGK